MAILYNFFLALYRAAIFLAALGGNEKARQWRSGRKNIFGHIRNSMKPGERRVWFHCASLGEFEQGRPLIEKFRTENPGCRIVLTFFSPSGYEVRKNYAGADYVFYLPPDSHSHAKQMIGLLQPEKVFFVKYEYWFHYLDQLKKNNIPVYVVSAIFRSDQRFFAWYGGFFRKMLNCVTHFFVQDEESAGLLKSIGLDNHTVTGDTRFDRVAAIAEQAQEIAAIGKFCEGKKTWIAGSTWEKDEEIIVAAFSSLPARPRLIIAPHEIREERILHLMNRLKGFKTVRYSMADVTNVAAADVLVIDNIGLLSSLYRYGTVAWIGGGFGSGIHNILEAAVFGLPVLFGPHYQKFREANELISLGGAFSFTGSEPLQACISTLLTDDIQRNGASAIAREYVQDRKGATLRIMQHIMQPN